ncbi:hypothetical protein ACFQ6C_26290 [Streptomyces sp. NPDC056454]|uniref:hypothetical protein n=1 Tax=Streptomyces sp. NPDC056454 TaxID=3345823 RepID=UPI00367B21FD
MTGPVVHELLNIIDVSEMPLILQEIALEMAEKDLRRRVLNEARCLRGDETKVEVTSQPCLDYRFAFSDPHGRLFKAQALCPDPDTCDLNPRKADR